MIKNWLVLCALTFGVGFGISLTLDRDIKRAALTGLITLPATATGVSVVEHRRRRQMSDPLSKLQARVEELAKQEALLSQSLSRLQTQIEDLKQQEVNLEQSLFAATTDKQQVEQALAARQTELDQLQAQVAVQQSHKQQVEQALASLGTQKQQLEQESRHLQTQLQELKNQETTLNHFVAAISDEKQQVEVNVGSLKTEFNQLQTQVLAQQQLLSTLGQERLELEAHQRQLTAESHHLQTSTQELRQQESRLNQSLGASATQKQQAEDDLNLHRTQLNQLQNQIAAKEAHNLKLSQDLAALEQQKHQLKTESSALQIQLETLEQKLAQLSQSLTTITAQKQETQDSLSSLQTELSQLENQVSVQQQQKEQLTQELVLLASQKDQLAEELRQLQTQLQAKENHQPPADERAIQSLPTETTIKPTDRTQTKVTPARILKELPGLSPKPTKDESVDASETKQLTQAAQINEPTPSRQRARWNSQRQRTTLEFDFMNSKYTKHLWEDQILPHWSHRERPAGQRFLGSICMERTDSDRLLNIVGQNLQQLNKVTYDSLQNEFYELEQKVVDEGIELLGLVRTKGGYKYVSTLWLQSGVPEQNLNHFAQLVQEIADEYGWWELAHTAAEDLSQVLLSFCEEKHPQWGTLINFLKSSYSEDTETEPISGQLLQGIAIVAQELERQKASPQALQDEHQREELLSNYYLPQNFFLRNWNALIQVLAPRPGSGHSRGIASRRSKPLFMSLDIADSGNTHLVLPKQALWKPEWRSLQGTYCQIPEANWEDTIPTIGDLIVPELVIEINQASEDWNCRLLDHNHQHLLEWHYEGISSHLPCLVFDALTGEHLPLRLPNLTIISVEEVICFTPKDIQPEFTNGIEVLDSCIPSSIRGWRGRLIRLTTPESLIVLTVPETNQSQLISWKLATDDEPVLRGLRLKGKKSVYLETPTFWYSPINKALILNLLIENITERNIIARTIETLSPNNRWFAIPLAQWITEPGCYEARFWFDQKRWSYRFEVQSKFKISESSEVNRLRIHSNSGFSAADLPIKHDTPEKFWSEVINVEGLWPLEEIILFLSNGNEKIPAQLQADASGILVIRLSVLYDLLPDSDWYVLDYQRLGFEPQRLVEMQTLLQNVSWTWANQAIHFSGLLPGKLYSLSCWNLLLPDKEPVEIKIPLIEEDAIATIVPLNLPTGIYHIQLVSSQRLPENMGWWCGSGRYDLPEVIQGNEARENYCYTILDSRESKEDFLAAVNQLNLDFDCQRIQAGILTLENNSYYLPDWLSRDSLLGKLKRLFELLSLSSHPPIAPPIMPTIQPVKPTVSPPVSGNWYLVSVRAKKRDLFLRYLKMAITKNQLQELILAVETPQESDYKDIILLNLSNFKAAYTHLQKIENFQSIERRPLKSEQVSRMLGAN